MRIGIDIDGVLTDVNRFILDHLSKFCVENNIDYCVGESFYDESKTFGIDKIDADKFWDEYLEFYSKHVKARPFASEIIKKLRSLGHEIFIVTARWLTNRDDKIGNKMRKTVKKWLADNKIFYEKLVFCKAQDERKVMEILDNKIDIMIEDSPKNIDELSKFVKVICFDNDYNKKCGEGNITRCCSWYDIYKAIENKKL